MRLELLVTAHVVLGRSGSPHLVNKIRGRIARRMLHGDFTAYTVDCGGGTITARRPPTESFEEGAQVGVSFAAERCADLQQIASNESPESLQTPNDAMAWAPRCPRGDSTAEGDQT